MLAEDLPPFGDYTGVILTKVSTTRVDGELAINPNLADHDGAAHRGAIMSFIDDLAGAASTANLAANQWMTTVECKVNFFAPIPVGNTARGSAAPLHLGRATHVWETRVFRDDGELAAVGIQTQMVINAPVPKAAEQGATSKPIRE